MDPAFSPDALAKRLAGMAARPDGPSRLSPFITHGLLSVPEAGAFARSRLPPEAARAWLRALARREHGHHLWRHHGTAILKDTAGARSQALDEDLPEDIRAAATGHGDVDAAIRALYETGWLPHGERVRLATFIVHERRLHWRVGAEWLYGHLLDGDLASNHLAWQAVAGAGGDAPPRVPPSAGESGGAPARVEAPPLLAQAPGIPVSAVPPRFAPGETVALVHPWCLGEPPAAGRVVAVFHAPFHERYRWSAARFASVAARMRVLAGEPWFGDVRAMVRMNRAVRFVTTATLNTGYAKAVQEANVAASPVPRLFADPQEPCGDFESFWRRAGPGA